MRVTLESETECGMVLCADDPELLNKLDWAAEKGQLEGHWIGKHINFVNFCHVLCIFKPSSVLLVYWYCNILCCRVQSPVVSHGTCCSLSRAFVEINACCWLSDIRHQAMLATYSP